MKRRSIFLFLIFCVVISACLYGCRDDVISPTGSSVSSSGTGISQDKSDESNLNSTASEASVIHVIPDRYVQFIYPGISSDSLKRLAGIDPFIIDDTISVFMTDVGRKLEFQFLSDSTPANADLIKITDGTGEQQIAPIPDDKEVEDFSIIGKSVALKLNGSITEDELIVFGNPVQETFTSGSGDEAYGEWRKREVHFADVSLVLIQLRENVNTSNWRIWEMTVRSPEFVTPRGLRPGIDLADALSRLGTGDIMVDLSLNRDHEEIGRVMICKLDASGHTDEYHEMILSVSEDKIIEIRMLFRAP
jgi:hypothetical protein